MTKYQTVLITLFYVIFITIKGSSSSGTDDKLEILMNQLQELEDKFKNVLENDNEHESTDSQRSCISCIFNTLLEHRAAIMRLLNNRDDIRKDHSIKKTDEIQDKLLKPIEKINGNLESHKRFVQFIQDNFKKWGFSCKTDFPTGVTIVSFKIGTLDNNKISNVYSNHNDLTLPPSDKNILTCMRKYVKNQPNQEFITKYTKVFEENAADMERFIIKKGLTSTQINCLSCIKMALADQIENMKIAAAKTKNDSQVYIINSNMVSCGLTFHRHISEWLFQCLLHKPNYPQIEANHSSGNFAKYKNTFMDYGGYRGLNQCINYYTNPNECLNNDCEANNVVEKDCEKHDCKISDYFDILETPKK